MNTQQKQDVQAKFETFFQGVSNETITEDAKKVFLKAPTKWAQFVEVAVSDLTKSDELDGEERLMFMKTLVNLREKIAVTMSLSTFVDWMESSHYRFEVNANENLSLVSFDKDTYDVLESFLETFYS